MLRKSEPWKQADLGLNLTIKRPFGHVNARYRGLKKNTAQLRTLFALSNLWMARRSLMGAQA